LKVFASVNEPEIHAKYLPPPMLCNLRVRQPNRQAKLPAAYINQIKRYGDAVTFFIHGYNVGLGHLGQFPSAEELGNKPAYYFNAPKPEEVQRPYLHFLADDIEQYANTKLAAHPPHWKSTDRLPKEQFIKQADEKLNGKNALSWYPNVEYYLNLAASGQDELREFTRWEDYSRIVGVTWSGSVDPSMVFFRAEMYANEAGHQFALILQDLIKKDIQINIITHSLGARVALSALNILGNHPTFKEAIDNLIMWEAAVADNALTENYTKEHNPIAMELFPFAHRAAKHISVIASDEDGVLGGDYDFKRAKMDSFSGLLGGAYPKKYTHLASDSFFLGGGLSALLDYYRDNDMAQYIGLIYQDSRYNGGLPIHPNSVYARGIKEKIRHLFLTEADEINRQANEKVIPPLDSYHYLKPWSHYRYFYPDILAHIVEAFCDTLFNGMATNTGVRQALGFVADKYTRNKKSKYYDAFIAELFGEGILSFNDQTIEINDDKYPYFLSHSAMRDFEWRDDTIQSFRIFDLIYS
ncbi:alpha/beta hydrolase, partial [Rodentibacter myodis]